MTAGLLDQLRRARPSITESPTYLVLMGKITDLEYRQLLVAESQRFGIPRRGWSHRHARIRRTVLEVLALLTSILMFIFVIWACAGASLPGDVR